MKIHKKIIVTFVTAILTIMVICGGYAIYAGEEKTDYDAFINETSFYSAKALYHESMNKYFNDKLEKLVELLENENFLDDENFKVPVDVEKLIEKDGLEEVCGKNVSTYCVAMKALDLHMAYLDTLNRIKGYLPDSQQTTLEGRVVEFKARNEGIEQEVKDAKLVLEGAIAAYDEFKMAYPVHQKYKEIIKNLTKYRIAMKKIQNETIKFPLRFVDATSSKCE